MSKDNTSHGLAKSISRCINSRVLNYIQADKITRFYHTPSKRFTDENQVIEYYGYKLGKKLAEGGFSTVYYATHLQTNIQVACKKVDLAKTKNKIGKKKQPDQSKIEDLKNELLILKKLRNPYLVKLYAHFVINTNLYIFLKLANSGTLAKYVKMKGVLSERESQILFAQILVAVEYLHSLSIAHRDIKLENILLLKHPNHKLTVLITDFGFSRLIPHEDNGNVVMNSTYCGTPDYMAPEILLERPYNAFLVDIWALGVALYAMLNNRFPFEAKNSESQVKLQLGKKWKLTDNIVDNALDQLIHILTVMLEPNPSDRISIKQLVKHPWIINEFFLAKTYFQNYSNLKH